jgi:hypothetical protein
MELKKNSVFGASVSKQIYAAKPDKKGHRVYSFSERKRRSSVE